MNYRNRLIFWPLVALGSFLFVQGLSGVVYFAAELVKPVNLPGGIALGVVLSNTAGVLAALAVVVPVYLWRHQRPAWKWSTPVTFQQITWKHYALIAFLTLVMDVLFSYIVGYLYWSKIYQTMPASQREISFNPFYLLPPVITACLLYYWLTRERYQSVRFWEQEAQMLKLNELKTRAELDALQAKINPHFLHNALNSIASLVHTDPDKAERMTLLLSKFFRYSTSVTSQYYDTVDHELEMVSTYLDVEKVRFDERLSYSIELQDERLRQRLIPRFLLQPLVENAIKHGISKRADDGQIRLVIEAKADRLIFCLHDNGPPFPENLGSGYGLQSIRDKLRLLCGPDATLELVNQPQKHVKISLVPKALTAEAAVELAVNQF
ncbi:MAG: histidine kinase [Cytophagaceae bacterium]|nr:histidine kinase [Cytophagaceae bacterium]